MTEDLKNRLTKIAKFFAFKAPLIIAVLVIMMIASLKMVERYPDPLRQGFEDYLSRTYGSTATIGQLDEVSFFPKIEIKARDITMHNKSNAAIIDIEVEAVHMRAPFLSMMFGTGKIEALEVENLKASAGFILPQSLRIDTLSIIEKEGPDQYGAFLVAKGRYANDSMGFEAEIEKSGKIYVIGDDIPFSLSRGSASLNAQIVKQRRNTVVINNAVYAVGSKTSQARNYTVLEKAVFQDNNPLTCLVKKDKINQCEEYLTK